jgi:hypothetical protein
VATPVSAKAAPQAGQRPLDTGTDWPQRGQRIGKCLISGQLSRGEPSAAKRELAAQAKKLASFWRIPNATRMTHTTVLVERDRGEGERHMGGAEVQDEEQADGSWAQGVGKAVTSARAASLRPERILDLGEPVDRNRRHNDRRRSRSRADGTVSSRSLAAGARDVKKNRNASD